MLPLRRRRVQRVCLEEPGVTGADLYPVPWGSGQVGSLTLLRMLMIHPGGSTRNRDLLASPPRVLFFANAIVPPHFKVQERLLSYQFRHVVIPNKAETGRYDSNSRNVWERLFFASQCSGEQCVP